MSELASKLRGIQLIHLKLGFSELLLKLWEATLPMDINRQNGIIKALALKMDSVHQRLFRECLKTTGIALQLNDFRKHLKKSIKYEWTPQMKTECGRVLSRLKMLRTSWKARLNGVPKHVPKAATKSYYYIHFRISRYGEVFHTGFVGREMPHDIHETWYQLMKSPLDEDDIKRYTRYYAEHGMTVPEDLHTRTRRQMSGTAIYDGITEEENDDNTVVVVHIHAGT